LNISFHDISPYCLIEVAFFLAPAALNLQTGPYAISNSN